VTCNLTRALSTCSSNSAAQRTSITRLDLSENNLVGWIDNDTRVEKGLRVMHDCGLTALILGGGDIGINGTLASFWGTFTNLEQLVISKASIYGSLPANLGNLVQLRQLDLNGNYLYGALLCSRRRRRSSSSSSSSSLPEGALQQSMQHDSFRGSGSSRHDSCNRNSWNKNKPLLQNQQAGAHTLQYAPQEHTAPVQQPTSSISTRHSRRGCLFMRVCQAGTVARPAAHVWYQKEHCSTAAC
jgi:hypothetical protein